MATKRFRTLEQLRKIANDAIDSPEPVKVAAADFYNAYGVGNLFKGTSEHNTWKMYVTALLPRQNLKWDRGMGYIKAVIRDLDSSRKSVEDFDD